MPVEIQFLEWLHGFATPFLDGLFVLSHHLASRRTCLVLVVAAVVLCAVRRAWRAGFTWIALGVAVGLTQNGLKILLARPRPALWDGPIRHDTFAMPSGHALASAAFYSLIAYFVARRLPAYRIAVYGTAAALCLFVGGGRLYLGVHWPSDVLAGWTLGAAMGLVAIRYLSSSDRATRHDSR